MFTAPLFTVVVACAGRGRHIRPTIDSVLCQSLSDFELLLVCDGPDEEALAALPTDDPRFGNVVLPWASGCQSTPNNVGNAVGRGRFVAYLGHDDLWAPDHLANLARCFAETGCDIAVAGCAYLGPPSTDMVLITGLFDHPAVARTQFFPPSSLAHRRRWPAGTPHWRPPDSIAAPVDADFLLRAVEAGAKFASTGQISTYKFAAGHRYLSYLTQTSDEQATFLAAMRAGTIDDAHAAKLIELSKAAGTFMCHEYPDFAALPPGQIYRNNRANKGIDRATSVPLTGTERVPVSSEPRALDWHSIETNPENGMSYRWSGPSLRPKLLIPFTGNCPAQVTLHLYDHDPAEVIGSLRLTCNGQEVAHETRRDREGWVDLDFVAALRAEQPSVVELLLPRSYCPAAVGASADVRRLGVMFSGFTIAPAH